MRLSKILPFPFQCHLGLSASWRLGCDLTPAPSGAPGPAQNLPMAPVTSDLTFPLPKFLKALFVLLTAVPAPEFSFHKKPSITRAYTESSPHLQAL